MSTNRELEEAGRAQDALRFGALPGDAQVSFEFFPPRTDAAQTTLWDTVQALAPYQPEFVSVTYGAGGTTQDRSYGALEWIVRDTNVPVAGHLTCVGASRDEVDAVADSFWQLGVRHIVALRGDAAGPGQPFEPHPQGYTNAADLVAGLKRLHPFEISVAAYPECHPASASVADDLDNLKRKLDAGATRALTQFFFEADTFFRFRDAAAAAGIEQEIVPGILPIVNFKQARDFAGACGARMPDWMGQLFEGLEDQPAVRQLVSATVAADQCRALYAGGVRSFHFYTLNRAELTAAICRLLGRRGEAAAKPAQPAEAAAA